VLHGIFPEAAAEMLMVLEQLEALAALCVQVRHNGGSPTVYGNWTVAINAGAAGGLGPV
jgi:hypothetical protein